MTRFSASLVSLSSTVCGQCFGAKRPDLTWHYTRNIIRIGRVIQLCTLLILYPLMPLLLRLENDYHPYAIIPVSASENDGLDEIMRVASELAQPSVHFFPDDKFTDQPERVLAAEMIREKLLRLLNDEVPHGVAVTVEKLSERDDKDLLDISAVIYCERESHKGIIIGKNGSMLKKIASSARRELEHFFEIQVNLQCFVKVKEDWRNKEGLIRSFGLNDDI